MVRDSKVPNEPHERPGEAPARPRRRSFSAADLPIDDPQAAREVIARAESDFERIFGRD